MFQKMFKIIFVHFGVLNISNDVKHIVVFFFVWYHKMVSPQKEDTRSGPPPFSDAIGCKPQFLAQLKYVLAKVNKSNFAFSKKLRLYFKILFGLVVKRQVRHIKLFITKK